MRGRSFVAVLVVSAWALVCATLSALPALAQDAITTEQPAVLPAPSASPTTPTLAADQQPQPAADSIVVSIRLKLAEFGLRKGVAADDLAALEAFYGGLAGPPIFVTVMGFTAKAQGAIFEIEKADDWGLSAAAFDLPPAGGLPATTEAQATAEIKLALAILKYARHARGGRIEPAEVSDLLDQAPPLRDPKTVLTEIAAAAAPDAYLRSLHPKHEQFERLRQALLKARGKGEGGAKQAGSERDIQRLLINMERWRWMPENLGTLYVWNNVPEYILRVVKNGAAIHSDKILVGKLAYATPIFSADMQTVVFNPEWTVPETIVRENLLPNLRGGGWTGGGSTSILREHGLQVKYNGRTVDPGTVNWNSVKMANISFTQAPGPDNVLGKLKFLFPNKHVVYMHDTIKRELFKQAMRAEGHNCIRVADPGRLASVLLAEDKGWPSSKIDDLLDHGNNSAVTLDHPIPVHMTYFTAMVDDDGKVKSFADIYGLDSRIGKALLGKDVDLPPAPEADEDQAAEPAPSAATSSKRNARNDLAGSMQGLFGE
jgi:murein L,D-transpeptidase YcbB/YkuD